jgi:hypothetical protein
VYFYATKPGPDAEALKLGFRKCGELAVAGKHQNTALAVPTKGNLQGLISDLIGDEAAGVLARDKALDLGGLTIRLVTKRVPLRHCGPVLGAWTTIDHVKELARSEYATAIVFLPWLDEELSEFRASFPDARPLR